MARWYTRWVLGRTSREGAVREEGRARARAFGGDGETAPCASRTEDDFSTARGRVNRPPYVRACGTFETYSSLASLASRIVVSTSPFSRRTNVTRLARSAPAAYANDALISTGKSSRAWAAAPPPPPPA